MSRRKLIYEGKAKVLFEGPEQGTVIQYFKDDATAFNNQKKGTITGKGVLNNSISEFLMIKIAEMGVPTHFIKRLNMREQLVKKVDIVPIEVVVRNVAAGSIVERLNIKEVLQLKAKGVKISNTKLLKITFFSKNLLKNILINEHTHYRARFDRSKTLKKFKIN